MKRKIFSILFALVLALGLSLVLTVPTGANGGSVHNINTGEDFATIQAAIDDSDTLNGHTITVDAGTYNEYLNVNKSVSIVGAGLSQVTINVSGLAFYNAGIYVSADNVSLQGFTVLCSPTNSTPRYGIKFGAVSGGSLTEILVRDIYRSGFDFLGTGNTTISNVESRDNGGHGISLVDCNNITLSDITTSGSGWQAISVATWGRYTPLGTSGIVLTGTNSFDNVFQLEEGDYNNPGVAPSGEATITYSTNIADGADVTVQASDFGYALHGDQDDGPDQNRIWFFKTLTEAQVVPPLAPVGHLLASGIYIESLTDRTQLYISPGCEIQAAIDAANPAGGTTINVAAGTYTEAVTINKSLTLRGATADVNKNGYTVPANYAWDDTVESIIMHPNPGSGHIAIVDIYDVSDVTFEGFVVQELNAVGNADDSLVRVRAQTHEVSNIVFRNNIIGPFTNTTAQNGTHGRMGLYLVNNPYSDQYGIVNSTFSGNKIFDCKGNGNNVFLWSSYFQYGALGPASMAGTVIEDNEICGAHRSGIETAGGFSDLTIRNNSIYGNGGPGITGKPDLMFGNGIVMIRGSGDKTTTNGYGPVNVTIENNEIYDNEGHGIYMGPNNEGITITGNNLYNNGEDAIMVDLIGNYWNPDFETGPGPYTNLAGSQNVTAQFNNIYDNAGYGTQVVGTPTNGFVLDATNNWWGAKDGPSDGAGVTDPVTSKSAVGSGDKVSANVHFDPWIGASVEESKTETVTDGTVDGKDEADTEVIVTGTATVTVAQYSSNPGTGSFSGDTGKYIDVQLTGVAPGTEIEIRLYYTNADIAGPPAVDESTLALRWWNGTTWVECSDSGVNTTDIPGPPPYSGYMWAKIRNDTIPNLTQLTGTAFGGGGALVGGGGGGGALPISKVGSASLLQYLDWQGRTRIEIKIRSADGVVTLVIPQGTLMRDAEGKPLANLGVTALSTPPPPAGYVLVGHAYDCVSEGATFSPKITLIFTYTEGDIPDGGSEGSLVLAYWDGDEWINLPTTINSGANTATAGVEHFTPFALMAYTGLANFSASNLSIQPLEVQPNDVVTITLSVANTGDTEGSYNVVLKINGATEAEKSVTLAAGASQSVSFSVAREEAGSYSVDVNGLSGSFTVVAPAPTITPIPSAPPAAKPPINWMWIGIIAAAVVVAGLIIFFVVRRRAY